ncbi:MAG: transaldolase [Thermomicrobium sp.]
MVAILRAHGQVVWLDDLSRSILASGELAELVQAGIVSGITTNPAIFQRAITQSPIYDAEIVLLSRRGLPPGDIVEALMVRDVAIAADLLRPTFEQSGGSDGFVSIEVDPRLAHDTYATVTEAKRLWWQLDRPNIFIKVPATAAGVRALTLLIAEGINVNATLIFSVERYLEIANAYLTGLERRLAARLPLAAVTSVASLFVSRLDTKVDHWLDAQVAAGTLDPHRGKELRGQAALANARLAYQAFLQLLATPRWQKLAQAGARPQRLLWASTSTKDPQYSDVKYIEGLVAPQTITTIPRTTLEAFLDHGRIQTVLTEQNPDAAALLQQLEALGLDLPAVFSELEVEGIAAFEQAYLALISAVAERSRRLALAAIEGGG